MPDFGANVPTAVADDVSVTLYGFSRVERGFSFPDRGGSDAQAIAAVTALCNLSNMGCISWTFKGLRRYISDAQVVVRDEAYGESETATLIFQDTVNSANPEVTIRIPAPGAEIFKSGVLVDEGVGLVDTAILAVNAFLNSVSGNYVFGGGYKNTAKKGEKRQPPQVLDPSTGDSEGPGLL